MEKKDYPKAFLSIDNQIAQLQERGLIIDDLQKAKNHLKNISYFRLQGFWWELQEDKKAHKFIEGATFDDVLALYTFDRKLRLLVFDAIERIEIALRTKLIYYPSVELKDWWWFEEPKHFHEEDYHNEALNDINKELSRTKEVFIESHYANYGAEHLPPCYKTFEILSLGTLSKIYSNLNNSLGCKKRIAEEFDLPNSNFLKSWLLAFNVIRNICAHHSRLWNRNIHLTPKQLSKPNSDFISIPESDAALYYPLSCILYVLNKISPGHSIKNKFLDLFNENPNRLIEMGFPEDWNDQPLWS